MTIATSSRIHHATRRKTMQAAFAALALISAAPAQAREYFVSGTGADMGNAEGSESKPFQTLQKAASLTAPGDVVTVMNGTYKNACPSCSVLDIKRSGTDQAWITYRAYPGHSPKLKFNGWSGINLSGGASYIEINGFEIEGNLKDTTLEYCTMQKDVADPLCNGNGISVDGRNDGANKPHHIRILHNLVHDCSGGGVSAIDSDYITIEDNQVHDTSWYTRYATSGISLLTAWNFDNSTAHKMFIQRNKVWNNKTQVPSPFKVSLSLLHA